MFELLKNYKGKLKVNETLFETVAEAQKAFQNFQGILHISLNVNDMAQLSANENVVENNRDFKDINYLVKVRSYMTKPFGFHEQWNNSKPMPMRMMVGKILEETPGMYKMELHGTVMSDVSSCMVCGRKLTNPVSKYFGIGPECGHHGYVNPFDSKEELDAAISEMNKKLHEIKWTGWVIKRAIELWEEYDESEAV